MKKGILHIELVDGPAARESQGKHRANSSRLHHGTECLIKVHTKPLGKAAENPARLVPFEGAIRLKLVLEDPLVGDDVGPRGSRHEIPSVILQQGTVFLFHCSSPHGVGKSATEGLRYR